MFNQLVLTDVGQALLTQLLAGHTIEFTKIKMGKAATAPANIAILTDVVSVAETLTIARASVLNGTQVNIGANLMGVDVTEAFDWTEIGIFAKDITAAGSEILFSYQYATSSVPIPIGGTVVEMLLDFVISVGNSSNVSITLDASLIFLTQADLDAALGPINTAITNLGDNKEAKLTAGTASQYYRGDKTWQTLDKAAVGLGNVVNQGTATDAEATAGTVTNKNMTPKNVKDAVTAYSAITDGNVIIKIGTVQPTPQAGKTIIFINTAS